MSQEQLATDTAPLQPDIVAALESLRVQACVLELLAHGYWRECDFERVRYVRAHTERVRDELARRLEHVFAAANARAAEEKPNAEPE